MIRLPWPDLEAHAHMRFADVVELAGVREACRLLHQAIWTSAMDPCTGMIDMRLLNTGAGSGQRKLKEDVRKEVQSLLDGAEKGRYDSRLGSKVCKRCGCVAGCIVLVHKDLYCCV